MFIMISRSSILSTLGNLTLFKNIDKLIPIFPKMSTAMDGPDVLLDEIGNKSILTLNRPRVFNTFDISMLRKIIVALKKWEKENRVCVIVKGAGGKSFCAGGDVIKIALDSMKGGTMGIDFIREYYALNGIIGNYKIPYIPIMDGIVTGGGVGLAVHGKYRVATEKSVLAVSEAQIGLVPDIGVACFLSKLKGKLGLYLALTGDKLKGIDLLKANIATHYITSGNIPNLQKALLQCTNTEEIVSCLNEFNVIIDTQQFILEPYVDKIDSCFSASSIEEILVNLKEDGSDWAIKTLQTLTKMSPTSLKVTLRLLEIASKLNLKEALKYSIEIDGFSHDFFEGVRAVIIEKDENPKWKPSKLKDVTEDMVNNYLKVFSKL